MLERQGCARTNVHGNSFYYMTRDGGGTKLWRKKPKYSNHRSRWFGSGFIGFADNSVMGPGAGPLSIKRFKLEDCR